MNHRKYRNALAKLIVGRSLVLVSVAYLLWKIHPSLLAIGGFILVIAYVGLELQVAHLKIVDAWKSADEAAMMLHEKGLQAAIDKKKESIRS